tara:strand:+ start:882 stop:1781 length:900 start_codon:yes stop_codon:yes gene_type:complete
MPDIALYAQTFPKDNEGRLLIDDIRRVISNVSPETMLVIYISSLHFGRNQDGSAYLHLNDTDVMDLDYFFRSLIPLWSGKVQFRVMLGGAGGAYNALYTDYSAYMDLLLHFMNKYSFISGIDLDIEEPLHPNPDQSLARVKQIINDISSGTSKSFAITLAPVASSLTDSGAVGMGNFSYSLLKNSSEWGKIECLNVQAYGAYDYCTFKQIISAGFNSAGLRMGMLGDNFGTTDDYETALLEIEKIVNEFPQAKGVILWEAGDTSVKASLWAHSIERVFRNISVKPAFNRESGWNSWCSY